jgi:hypothetical protein
MTYTTQLALTLSTLGSALAELGEQINERLKRFSTLFEKRLLTLLTQPIDPTAVFDFETQLAAELRELGRELLDLGFNRLEGDDPDAMPSHVRVEGTEYRLVRAKTRQPVDTCFGPISLRRYLYRPVERGSPEPAIAPLARALGVVENTTPALAGTATRYLAEAGATQRVVQERLQSQHGVAIGTKRLRALADHISGAMATARQESQVKKVLDLLHQANQSSGGRKPVLCVGRDGITLRKPVHGQFEVASTATMTVFDRAGRRLGTVYLAFVPESCQRMMSKQLTGLIEAVLRDWDGPMPRLAYVTDAGENETQYYDQVLRSMTHPRTGERLEWQRVVDFYHVMERVWSIGEALFGATKMAQSWARKMCRLLKKPNGPFRMLHAAAAMRSQRSGMSASDQEEYSKAYNYLKERTAYMQYHTYQQQHMPIGSGITEAACKTIFTQRLKLSGMRWSKAGAQVILDLRVVLLSGVWNEVYREVLKTHTVVELAAPEKKAELPVQIAC